MELKSTVNNVIENKMIADGIYKLVVKGSFSVKPGQFFMLRSWDDEPFLSRPISINDVDEESISFLYIVKGKGTELLSRLVSGDEVKLLGPVGNGFKTEDIKGKVAVVTGGIGIAPMMLTVKNLKDCSIDLYAGFRDSSYLTDEMKGLVDNVYVSSETGSEGYKGYITEIFNPLEYNAVLCCGPEVMMDRIVKICRLCATPVYVSMEQNMACGIGACLVCTCETNEGNKRVCKDGPVFSGRDVIMSA